MAGLPDYSDNPITSGNAGASGDQSMEVALAAKMQLILDQPMADIDSGLTNRDFEGDFFKIGDTVALVKPDISSLAIEFGTIATQNTSDPQGKPLVDGSDATQGRYSNKDARLIPTNVEFDKKTLVIDKYAKYAFYISDFTEAEGKWNYESGNLDAVAQEMRKRHNLETAQLIIDRTSNNSPAGFGLVPTVNSSSAAAPITVTSGDDVYEKVIVPTFAALYDAGAITADGQITYGSNAQEGKATFGCIYLPTKLYTMLLTSKYLQDRSTVAADEKVKTGRVKTVMGLDVAIEPSLNPDAKRHVDTGDSDVMAVIAGTRNLVTKAGKVLPPEKIRSHKFFADEYHGCELYTKEVVTPDAGIVAFVEVSEGE